MKRIERWRRRFDLSILLLIAFSCQKLSVCDSLDSEGWALLRFRDGVKVDPYGALSNWGKRGADHCVWFGVECSDDGMTVSL
ncbi:hypothetical protein KSP40_PGU022486 [Platanthera guangdongensis]|uniref:Leucine-rich repeat-containing N-terminal plant-type domain-containing protein n=1 Tax=Platanthera guangdongensis TaxID=2320717 RepID=A0ABR2LTB1_9ASPA